MSNLGLTIRIPKENLIKLSELQTKHIVVKFSGGREVSGTLKCWDKAMNLILENTQEVLGVENGEEITRALGLIIVKGSQVALYICRFKLSV
jgi:U6 snRNA-associated Sm-like protein LSm7